MMLKFMVIFITLQMGQMGPILSSLLLRIALQEFNMLYLSQTLCLTAQLDMFHFLHLGIKRVLLFSMPHCPSRCNSYDMKTELTGSKMVNGGIKMKLKMIVSAERM